MYRNMCINTITAVPLGIFLMAGTTAREVSTAMAGDAWICQAKLFRLTLSWKEVTKAIHIYICGQRIQDRYCPDGAGG